MRKLGKVIPIILVLILVLLFNMACNTSSSNSSMTSITEDKQQITHIKKSSFYEAPNKYQVIDSYLLDDGNYYYFYYLGAVDYVPLNLSNSEGVYFNGKNLELTFKLSKTNKEQSEKVLKNAIENSVSITNSTYQSTSLSADIYSMFEAKIEAGISQEVTRSISNTFTESYSEAVSKESTFEKTISYKMNENDAVGFYFYTAVASMKIYEVVIYNPTTEKIECISTYSELGAALPSLYYSPFSFIDYTNFNISFDESKLYPFTPPIATASSNITVAVDPNGTSCSIDSIACKIGSTYGELPIVEKTGYEFLGWFSNEKKIEPSSIVVSSNPLIARWKIITSGSFSSNQTVTVNSESKLNPFGLLVSGHNGKTQSAGLDIAGSFDFATLKAAGYKMRIILSYDAKQSWNAGGLFGKLKYNFVFQSNNKNIITISDKVTDDSYVSKRNISEYIDLSQINGSLDYTISTENVRDLYIKNLQITIEFVL